MSLGGDNVDRIVEDSLEVCMQDLCNGNNF